MFLFARGMGKKIWISNPHEGAEEHEFEYAWVNFSDGITRAIYSSATAPVDYWPREVYILDMLSSEYKHVGSYKTQLKTGVPVYELILL